MIPTRRSRLAATAVLLFTAWLCVLALAGAPAAHAQHAPAEGIAYEIIVPLDREPRLDVRLTIFPEAGFAGRPVELRLPEGLSPEDVRVVAPPGVPAEEGAEPASRGGDAPVSDGDGNAVRIDIPAATPVTVGYSVRLRGGLINPAAQPEAPYASAYLGDFAYVAGRDTLARPVGAPPAGAATVTVHLPPEWRAFAADIGELPSGRATPVADVERLVLLMGPVAVDAQDTPGGRVTVVTAGAMPWPAEAAAESLNTMVAALAEAGFGQFLTDVTFFHIRYPGALRLNPTIAGHTVGHRTMVLWTGLGGLDWWRKHAARTVIDWLLQRTVTTLPEAAWFAEGLPEYATLLLLHELGYMSADEMYLALRTLYATGIHYTGPGWPSLVLAGVTSPRSHASQRVLEFRAPLVAFLLDVELREASAGAASIMDIWREAAEEQRRNPSAVFHTARLLSSVAEFGDLSAFAEQYLFGSRIPPADFDGVYRRWLATRGEDGP